MAKTTQNKYGIILGQRLIFLPFERICDQWFFDGQPSNLRARSKCLRKRQVKSNFSAASNPVIYGKKSAKGKTLNCSLAHSSSLLPTNLEMWVKYLVSIFNPPTSLCQLHKLFLTTFCICFTKVCERCFWFDNEMNRPLESCYFFLPYKSRRMSLFFSLIMEIYARAHSEILKKMFSRVRPHDQYWDKTIM